MCGVHGCSSCSEHRHSGLWGAGTAQDSACELEGTEECAVACCRVRAGGRSGTSSTLQCGSSERSCREGRVLVQDRAETLCPAPARAPPCTEAARHQSANSAWALCAQQRRSRSILSALRACCRSSPFRTSKSAKTSFMRTHKNVKTKKQNKKEKEKHKSVTEEELEVSSVTFFCG